MQAERYTKISLFLIITGIILGALNAHYLTEIIAENKNNSLNTGIKYQLFHAISLLVLSLQTNKFNHNINYSLILMTTGTCLFSVSIYLLTTQELIGINMSIIGPITPIGGVMLIISWIILFFSVKKIN